MISEGTTTFKLLLIHIANVGQFVKYSAHIHMSKLKGFVVGVFLHNRKLFTIRPNFFACNQTAGTKGDMAPFGMWALK